MKLLYSNKQDDKHSLALEAVGETKDWWAWRERTFVSRLRTWCALIEAARQATCGSTGCTLDVAVDLEGSILYAISCWTDCLSFLKVATREIDSKRHKASSFNL